MAATHTFPPLNFHFLVEFSNTDYSVDNQFSSVEGLHGRVVSVEDDGTPKAEFDTLILKRAYEPDSKLLVWCMKAINHLELTEEHLSVKLLNDEHMVVSAWNIENAVPVGWSVGPLNAEQAEVLIETIVLKYKLFQVVNSKGKVVAPIKDEAE